MTAAGVALGVLLAAPGGVSGQSGVPELESGIRAYTEEGNARLAIERIGRALDAGAVSTAGRPRAHVYMASAFLALGDTASALPHITNALAALPCLVPDEALTPPPWRALYERNRPRDADCAPKLATATLRSMIVPGWGQRTLDRTSASNYFFLFTAGAIAGAGLSYARAENRYSEYRRTDDPGVVVQLYDQAQRARSLATVLGGAAAALYVWNVVDAARFAVEHDARLDRDRQLAIIPGVFQTADGLALGFSIPVSVR